jgi:crossover junction endodeoxyribonuclease RuvC
MRTRTVIAGIDPGSRRTGYALVRFEGRRIVDAEVGCWSAGQARSGPDSLAKLSRLAEEWLSETRPDVAAVESPFHHRNARSALVLAEARGALLAVLGRLEIPVATYSPATVKKTICGYGSADKQQVRRALLKTVAGIRTLELDGVPDDASDALAITLCHHVQGRFAAVTSRGGR